MKTTTTKITNFMKRSLVPCIVAATLHPALAQPIFTNADVPTPTPGDSILEYNFYGSLFTTSGTDTMGGPSGASQTWNYSSLQLNTADSSSYTFYTTPAATPYAASFASANFVYAEVFVFGSFTPDTFYNYIEASAAKAEDFGFVIHTGSQTPRIYTNSKITANFPFTMSSSFLDTMITDYGSGNIFNEQRNISADGHGTLMLPNKTYNNALRVKTTSVHNDTTVFGVGQYTDTIYSWYAQGDIIYPVFKILRSIGTDGFGDPYYFMQAVVYKRSNPSVGIESYDGSISSTYPVPAKNELNIRLSNQEKVSSVIVTDLYGRQVLSKSVEGNHGETLTIALDNLSSGTFFVSILDNSNQVVGRTKFLKVN